MKGYIEFQFKRRKYDSFLHNISKNKKGSIQEVKFWSKGEMFE